MEIVYSKELGYKGEEERKFNFLYQNLSETDPYLNIDWFKKLSEDDMKLLRWRDKWYYLPCDYHRRIVHQACFLNKPTELIVFMIEKGLKISDIDIIEIIKNENFDLLRYYSEKFTIKNFNPHCFKYAILKKRTDMLQYLIEHKLVDMDIMKWHKNRSYAILKAVEACFETTNTSALWILFQNFPEQTKNCVEWVMDNFKDKDKNIFWFSVWIENHITNP